MTDDDGDGERAEGSAQLPRSGPSIDEADRLAANAEVHKDAWEQTLDDLRALEAEYEEEGWEVVTTVAGHTGPVAPAHDKGYWGLSHMLPDSDAERIEEIVADREFPTYDVYRNRVRNRVFMVVTYLDPETETAILLASNFKLREATQLVLHTREVGHVNSIFRFLDGTVVAEVRHEEPEKFFPMYDEFETFEEDLTHWPTFDDEDDGGDGDDDVGGADADASGSDAGDAAIDTGDDTA